MDARIRPAVLGNVPVLAFGFGGCLAAVLLDDVPVVVRASGVVLGLIAAVYVPVLFTTWFQFSDTDVWVSALGRVRCFRAGQTTLRLHRFPMGFFAEQTGVELRSGDAHQTVPLAVFSRKDRALIERELRARFGVVSAS